MYLITAIFTFIAFTIINPVILRLYYSTLRTSKHRIV
jgi:hypothetical protein